MSKLIRFFENNLLTFTTIVFQPGLTPWWLVAYALTGLSQLFVDSISTLFDELEQVIGSDWMLNGVADRLGRVKRVRMALVCAFTHKLPALSLKRHLIIIALNRKIHCQFIFVIKCFIRICYTNKVKYIILVIVNLLK